MKIRTNTVRPPASCTDADLLLGVAEKRSDCLQELYDRYFCSAYALAVRMLGDGELAEACAQAVFLELWQVSCFWDPAWGEFSTWLLTSVHRTACHQREMITQGQDDARSVASSAKTSADHAAAMPHNCTFSRLVELQEAARAAICCLPPAERAALELAYFDGLTPAEIATTLSQSPDLVERQISDGMWKLRAIPAFNELHQQTV